MSSHSDQETITLKQRRLQKLKEQQALKGISTPPEVLIEIEDLKAELERLGVQAGLARLAEMPTGDDSPPSPGYAAVWLADDLVPQQRLCRPRGRPAMAGLGGGWQWRDRNDCVPWHFARFLDFAAERIYLRKVDGGYIFIHRLLLEHFATMEIVEE